MKPKILIAAMAIMLLTASLAWSATTGAINGTIVDAQTKEAVPGVTVMIDGTSMGASTDREGRYSILNVPVGTYVLRISSVGFNTLEVSNVSVSIDLTTYQNHELATKVTDLDETIRVTAEAPMVQPDKVASIQIVKAEELLAMPLRGFEQVVGIQTGVVASIQTFQGGRSNREGVTTPEIYIRGGRQSEVAYYVDGFSQQDPLSGVSTGNISNNAIQEVSIVSGGFPAEYGHVMSGIVNVTTRSGGEKLGGTVEVVTDQKYGQNWYSATLGGPIPYLDKARFFGSMERQYFSDRNPSSVTADVLPDSPDRLPNNWLDGWSFSGKLDYDFSPTMKMAVTANRSRTEWQQYSHSRYFNSEHARYYNDYNLGGNARFTHTLSENTFYNLSGSYFVTERLRGDGVHRGDLWSYGRPGGNNTDDNEGLFRSWDNIDSVTPTVWEPSYVSIDTLRDTVGDTLIATDSAYHEFITGGDESQVFNNYLRRRSSYIGVKGDITTQKTREHTLKSGFEFNRHTLRRYEHLDPIQVWKGVKGGGFRSANRYGYDDFGQESDDEDWRSNVKNPIDLGLYLQDRIEYQGLIVTAGLRFDYFDYKALRLRNPDLPTNPDSLGFPGYREAEPSDSISVLARSDFEDSEAFTRISPRLGVSFPISDRSQMRLSYGKFFQRPNLEDLYVGLDYMQAVLSGIGRNAVFGNPNLEPPKTTAYEIGITRQIADNQSFDVNLFYRETDDLVAQVRVSNPVKEFQTWRNTDYGTIKGLEFNWKMRRTNNVMFDIKYTLSYANGTGSFSQENRNVQWVKSDEPRQTQPLAYDQRHKITGIFDFRYGRGQGPQIGDTYILERLGANFLLNAQSGQPYTPVKIEGYNEIAQISIAPTPQDTRNAVNRPWTYTVDMKLERPIDISGHSIVPYVWVKNLFNTDNPINVWEGTGRADAAGYLGTLDGERLVEQFDEPTDASEMNYAQKYELRENDPTFYSNPRQIIFGLRASF